MSVDVPLDSLFLLELIEGSSHMQSSVRRYVLLIKRWAWLVVLGIVICGGTTYAINKLLIKPVYQATATLIIITKTSTSPFDNFQASELAAPTYAQLLKSPEILGPVVTQYHGLTVDQLSAMVTVNAQPNTSLIELAVENGDPRLAADLANEIGQSFGRYVGAQFSVSVPMLSARVPINPIKPNPKQSAGLAALVGLGLAIALIIVFEWLDDRLTKPEEVQELLGMETLGVIPKLSPRRMKRINGRVDSAITEACTVLCANLSAAQAVKPFQLVMVTSALVGEGKSTVAANLATLLAKVGKHALLVDADLRNPALDQQGLSSALLAMGEQLTTLRVLTAGGVPPNPAELLLSPGAKQLFDDFSKASFDYIIVDTPALLSAADAQIVASYVQATILVVDASKTPRSVVLQAKNALEKTHTMLLGVVINKSEWPDYSYGRNRLDNIPRSKAAIAKPVRPTTPVVDHIDDVTTVLPRRKFRENEL